MLKGGDVRDRKAEKITSLLEAHKIGVIEELGPRAFDMLTPQETAQIAGVDAKRLPDLLREGWLEPIPGKDVGRAHQYYRWRAVFIQRYRRTRQK